MCVSKVEGKMTENGKGAIAYKEGEEEEKEKENKEEQENGGCGCFKGRTESSPQTPLIFYHCASAPAQNRVTAKAVTAFKS